MDVRKAVLEAEGRIRERVRTTPVEESPALGAAGGCRVQLKLENLQRTGSFKYRGAMNKLLSLTEEERGRGVVAASSGNHGAAVACGAASIGCSAIVFVPEVALPSKMEAIRSWGAEVRQVGADCVLAEAAARELAAERGMTYVSPYNDPAIVAGQGTVGVELERQLGDVDVVLVALGGGGLIGGIGGYLKGAGRPVEVIACSPENSQVMHSSLAAGRILELESKPTLSDGTAGGVEQGSITFELCREVVDDSLLVDEEQIAGGVRFIIDHHHQLVEGAAGVAVAGLLSQGRRFAGKNVVVVLCGANIDRATLKSIL